ncbi:hypothetical protein [Subtercola boreus]|uniref:hypothetical protein n=1 Tax=Subtercola boreus TaxID=120213 RepID=UPI00116FF1E0|nr:hypothetical protein [Subtercola boreus]TQL55788.1 hypothetical protein FB464_3362 [Subtercola boreus]
MQSFRTVLFIAVSVVVLAAIALVISLVVMQVIPGAPFSSDAPPRDIPAQQVPLSGT